MISEDSGRCLVCVVKLKEYDLEIEKERSKKYDHR